MINYDVMRKLIQDLNYYTKLYDEGHPQISDQQWDEMYFQLQSLEKESGVVLADSPTAKINYQIVNSLKKVRHNHPMLSLDKTKNENDVINFLAGHDAIAMAKMDGLTCSIKYQNGILVSAETRGNGEIGEDITHNIVFCKGVPLNIPIQDEVIVDGEVICTYTDFQEFEDDYANPRNFAAGSIRLLDSKECQKRKLTFIAWDCIKGIDRSTLSEKLLLLDQFGFIFVPYVIISESIHVHHAIVLLQKWAKDEGLPIDGIVFKYNDCAYYQSLGYTGHHFRGGLAFKFYDEEYETNLQDIEWSIGRTGQLTPVAIFDPIDDGESIVTRASLHNLNILEQLFHHQHPFIGQKIWICKQNQIIPQVVKTEKFSDKYSTFDERFEHKEESLLYPKICPICGGDTYIKDDFLYCSNPNCEGKFINRLDHFCSKKGLDIKGLSKATLEKLINWEWVNCFSDIFNLHQHRNEWYKKDGFGVKSVNNILQAIENSKNSELWRLIAAAGIQEIGTSASRVLANYYKTWDAFRAAVNNNEDFSHLPDFGFIMNKNIHNYSQENWEDMDKIASYMTISAAAAPDTKKILEGKVFCITGKVNQWKNRDSLKEYIESLGGKVTGSVTSKTDYLINNDNTSTTQKNITAQKLNKPILTEENFVALIDDLLAN